MHVGVSPQSKHLVQRGFVGPEPAFEHFRVECIVKAFGDGVSDEFMKCLTVIFVQSITIQVIKVMVGVILVGSHKALCVFRVTTKCCGAY